MEKWSGKYAAVTGASGGIGQAIVRELSRNGIHVIGLDINLSRIEDVAREQSSAAGKIYPRHCDVTDPTSVRDTFQWIEDQFGSIQILVNNAGGGCKFDITSEADGAQEKLDNVIDLNLKGLMHCTRAGIRLMKKSGEHGLVVNMSSELGHFVPFGARINMYAPTKSAVVAFSEVLRQELIVQGNLKIRVANLSPGAVKTDIFLNAGLCSSTEKFFETRPHLDAENIAQAIIFFLTTPYSVNITELTIKPVGVLRLD